MRKFRDIASIVVICLLAVVLLASSAQARPASVLLQEGLYAEEIEGDLDAAIRIYEQIAADKSAGARYAAQAMYRLGLCYQKKQDYQNAKATFEKLIARFPKEKSIVEKVQPLLDAMSAQDPAALMPPETLVYLEIGSPGKQIETILNMLKGTPLANPLNLINAPGGSGGGRSPKDMPKDMMAALLNPSMITEFKKIRGVALGFQAIQSNNPPLVAVIYPGESDALRGIIIAGLGMMLQAGEPIAGMQTLRMDVQGGAAYDDNVIILASPIDRLTWCVKQYKGITNEPTLVSQNKAFQKLSRKVREQNAYTIWADVDRIFPMLKEEMPDEQRRLIESIGDIGNVDEFTACLSLEKDGIAVETNIGFKDGHSCLAYDLIRTPNITKAGFEAVPPQAVGLVSFALSESEGGGVAGARKALKKLTGLDIGRELFANIEQITLFALPPTPTSTKNVLAESISPVVPCLGLAVTSHNPKRTEQLVTQLLTLTDLVMGISKGEEMVEQRYPAVGQYKIGEFNGKPAYCYVGQAGKSTVLTLSPEVLQASLSAVESKTSASSAGPLRAVLSQLLPGTSKLVAVNAAGTIQLANVHICESHGVSPDPEKNYFSQLLGQLAQACDETYAVVRTDEKANNFGLNVNISGLPEFGQVFPLVAQIPGAMENPMLAATRPRPADKAMVKPAAAIKLNWAPGRDATAHKVYFGTSIDKLPLLGEVKTPSYDELPAPERGITYYWRVDEVQADGSVVTGDIWSFRTGKLVAWWKFDETSGNTAEDSSGNNYHGTAVHGDPIWKPDGKFGGCLDFNERYGISISKGVFSSINKAITISVWVNGDENQANHSNVILQAGVGRRGKPYLVTVETEWKENGELDFKTGRGGRDEVAYHAALEEWAGRWNHYAFVKDADEGFMRIYVNGRLVAEQTGTTTSMAGVGAARIGIAPERFGDQYIGKLDDLRIYNYPLSVEEIQQVCGVLPGFGPVAEVELSDIDESPQAALIDFDTGKLVKIPDRLREAGGDEAFPWVTERGLDVGVEFARDEYGLFGIDVVATRIAPEQWDKITPAELHEALAAEPIGVEKDEREIVMRAKGEHPPTFAFRTREGGTGVLQVVDADRSKKTIHFRYKMLQEPVEARPAAPPVPGFGPVIERIVYQGGSEYECLIDFETGKLFKVPEPLRDAKGKDEEVLEWIKLTGVDAAGDTEGPIESQGLQGFPDDMAALSVPGGWDASPSVFIPAMRVFDPRGKARMFTKGDLPATYWFKTGERNMGVLQILGSTEGEPRGVRFRYKMLQPGVEESILKLQVVEPKREWWWIEPTVTKSIYEGSDLEIEWDVGKTAKRIRAFAVGVLPIRQDISDLNAHYYLEDNLAFTVRRTPYGKEWEVRQKTTDVTPKTLKAGEYRVYVCAFSQYRHGVGWSSRLTDVIGAGTAKLIVKPRPFTGAAPVDVVKRQVFLPNEDEPDVGVLLDLASGELLQILHAESKRPYGVWPERGRGDLTYDNQFRGGPGGESAYKHGLFCLRGAKARTLEKDGFGKLKIVLQSEDVTGYLLPRFPCRLLVTTAEGDSYEVQALAATENGINLEYRKLPGRPGQPDLAKALELAEGLYGLYQGVVTAIENKDTDTALLLVDQLITNGRAFEQMVKGTSAEMYVKAGGPVLEELRVALQQKQMDRAKSLINAFNQIGPPISSALEKAAEQQERVNSAQKLSRLGQAVAVYAADHNGKLPGTLQELKPYIGDFQWLIENVRYVGKGQESQQPDTPIAYDKTLLEKGNGTNILFLDGHVEFRQAEELTSVKRTIEHRYRLQ